MVFRVNTVVCSILNIQPYRTLESRWLTDTLLSIRKFSKLESSILALQTPVRFER